MKPIALFSKSQIHGDGWFVGGSLRLQQTCPGPHGAWRGWCLGAFASVRECHMGSCQDEGPFLGTLNHRCRIILRTQKGTLILTTALLALGMTRLKGGWRRPLREATQSGVRTGRFDLAKDWALAKGFNSSYHNKELYYLL